jgi:hypothetical protein
MEYREIKEIFNWNANIICGKKRGSRGHNGTQEKLGDKKKPSNQI